MLRHATLCGQAGTCWVAGDKRWMLFWLCGVCVLQMTGTPCLQLLGAHLTMREVCHWRWNRCGGGGGLTARAWAADSRGCRGSAGIGHPVVRLRPSAVLAHEAAVVAVTILLDQPCNKKTLTNA